MTGRIDTITLCDVLPEVFAVDEETSETIASSQVWRRELRLRRPESYAVNAASGTGKTSLCSFLVGVRADYAGKIMFNDTDIGSLSMSDWGEIRRRHIAYLPQELALFDELTALDNVLLKNKLTDCKSGAEIRQMFEELGVDNRINTPVGRMSVGQKQRVAVIRALCQPFDFILLDEPVSHLDLFNNVKCGELIAREAARLSASVITTAVGPRLELPQTQTILEL